MISEVENMATASASWIKHPGSYIKEEMEERDWSQRDLAFILGCSEQAINPILNGKRIFNKPTIWHKPVSRTRA